MTQHPRMSLPSTLKSHWKRLAVLVLLAGVGLLAGGVA